MQVPAGVAGSGTPAFGTSADVLPTGTSALDRKRG